ncbi:MAG: hypothetical protein WC326_03275 [Candidatus Delongbacteria bacterium]
MSQILRIRLDCQGPRVLHGRRAERRHAHPPIQPEGREGPLWVGRDPAGAPGQPNEADLRKG